jgi:predicted nucleic acid-binding protein
VKKAALDTSVVIAALLSWHEQHRAARLAVGKLLGGRSRVVLPAPVLIEAYSVMTRLPAPHRLAPADAHRILESSFEKAEMVSLTASESWRFLRESRDRGVAGGRTYDALILACATKARADRLLTLNQRDFIRLEPRTLDIVSP